jgi:aminopeptidase N
MAIDIYTAEGSTRHEVFVDERRETFVLPIKGPVQNINVDAEKSLLCEKEDVKPLTWWMHQMENAPQYRDRLEALDHAADTIHPLTDRILKLGLEDPHWSLRRKALSTLGKRPELVADWAPLVRARMKDSNTRVRAEALLTSALHFGTLHQADFETALQSMSYIEQSAGLEAMAAMDPVVGLAEAQKLQNDPNDRIQSTVDQVFALHGKPAQHDYFKQRMKTAKGSDLYGVIQWYGTYLAGQELTLLQSGLDAIEAKARDVDPWWVKYAAYQALNEIEGELQSRADEGSVDAQTALDDLHTRLDAIRRDETDERLFPALGK